MKHRIYLASVLLQSLVLTAGAWNGARAAHGWMGAPREALAAGRPAEHDRPLRVRPGSALAELAREERAIVFVYSPGAQSAARTEDDVPQLVRFRVEGRSSAETRVAGRH